MTVIIKGYTIQIDSEDEHYVREIKWYVTPNGCGNLYVQHKDRQGAIYLHRIIAGAKNGEQVDHVDMNTLNNRRANLRICTASQNRFNRGKTRKNTSGYKGVGWDDKKKKWGARIQWNGKQKFLGYFVSPVLAHEAYKKAVIEVAGEFARW